MYLQKLLCICIRSVNQKDNRSEARYQMATCEWLSNEGKNELELITETCFKRLPNLPVQLYELNVLRMH